MSAALYRAPWFLALSHASRGAGWALHTAALDLLQEQGAELLSEASAHLALACLPSAVRAVALRALLAVGLWTRAPGGYQLHQEPSAEVRHEPPLAPRSGAERTRAWREAKSRRDVTRDASPASSQSTSPSPSQPTSPAASRPSSHDVTEAENKQDPHVTEPVTPARAKENSPSSPLPTISKKEEGEGEENSPSPLPPSVTRPTSPAGVTGPFGAVLAAIPQAPQGEPEGDPLETRAAQAAALWADSTGRTVEALTPRDLDAIRVRCQERASLADFRAAFAHASVEAWYGEGDRSWPRLVCGSKWAECVRKGKARLGASGPSSSRRPVESAPPSAPPAPRPEPPETLPYGGPYAHPTRLRDHLGARYQPLPAEGIYLRQDLYLAREAAGKAAE